jgi:transcription initiation factor TFIIA large subunit
MPPQGVPQGMPQPGAPSYAAPVGQPAVKTEPGVVKIEPGLESANAPQPQFSNPSVQARVINNLQSQFGARADATINKLQESIGSAANGAQYPGQQRPGGQLPQQHPNPQFQAQQHVQQQYRQQQFAAGQQRPPQPMPNGQKPAASQFDGTAEEGVVVRRDAEGNTTELGRVEIDRMLHAQLEARAKAMEGGGLMLPLKRATKKNPVSYHRAQDGSGSGRFDGGDDDVKSEEDDEAINSDLDDSDDNLDEDDEDEDGGQIMLCMYDKVQRVKNKW